MKLKLIPLLIALASPASLLASSVLKVEIVRAGGDGQPEVFRLNVPADESIVEQRVGVSQTFLSEASHTETPAHKDLNVMVSKAETAAYKSDTKLFGLSILAHYSKARNVTIVTVLNTRLLGIDTSPDGGQSAPLTWVEEVSSNVTAGAPIELTGIGDFKRISFTIL